MLTMVKERETVLRDPLMLRTVNERDSSQGSFNVTYG